MADEEPCQKQLDDENICEETKDLKLVKKLMALQQQQIQDLNSVNQDGRCNELKIQTLEKAIKDLGDLNIVLVDTVTQLEQESFKYVEIFEKHLLKSSGVAERCMSQPEDSKSTKTTRELRRSTEELSEISTYLPVEATSLANGTTVSSPSNSFAKSERQSLRRSTLESPVPSTLPLDTSAKSPTASKDIRMGSLIKIPETSPIISPPFSRKSLSGSTVSAKSSLKLLTVSSAESVIISNEEQTEKSVEGSPSLSLITTHDESPSRSFDVLHADYLPRTRSSSLSPLASVSPSVKSPKSPHASQLRDSVPLSPKSYVGSTESIARLPATLPSASSVLAPESSDIILSHDSISRNMVTDSSINLQTESISMSPKKSSASSLPSVSPFLKSPRSSPEPIASVRDSDTLSPKSPLEPTPENITRLPASFSSDSSLLVPESSDIILSHDSLPTNMVTDSSIHLRTEYISMSPKKIPAASPTKSSAISLLVSSKESPNDSFVDLTIQPLQIPEESAIVSPGKLPEDTLVNHSARFSAMEEIPIKKAATTYAVKTAVKSHQLQIPDVDSVKHIVDTVLRKDKSESNILNEVDTNINIINDYLSDVKASMTEITSGETIDDFQKRLSRTTDELNGLEQRVTTYTNSLKEKNSLQTEWQEKIDDFKNELNSYLYKLSTVETDTDTEKNIQNYKDIVEEMQLTIDTMKNEIIAKTASLTSRETKVKQMEKYINNQKKILEDQAAQVTDANIRYLAEKKDAEDKYRECQEKLEETQKKLEVLQSELHMTHEEKSELLKKLPSLFDPVKRPIAHIDSSDFEVIYEREKTEAEPYEMSQKVITKSESDSDQTHRLQFCEDRMEKLANLVRQYQETLLTVKERYPHISYLIDPQLLLLNEKTSLPAFAEIQRASLTLKIKAKREQVSAKDDIIALLGKTLRIDFRSAHAGLVSSDTSLGFASSECEEELNLEELLDKLSDTKNKIQADKQELEVIEKEKSKFAPEVLETYNSILMSNLKLYNEQLELQDNIIKILKCLQEAALKRYDSEKKIKRESSVSEIQTSANLILELRKTQIEQRNEIIDILQNMNANLEKEIKKHMQQVLLDNSTEESYRVDKQEMSLKMQLKDAKDQLVRSEELISNVQQERKLSSSESCEAKFAVLLSKFEASEKQVDIQNGMIQFLQESLNQVLHFHTKCECDNIKEKYINENDKRYRELQESSNEAIREIERHNVLIERLEREKKLPTSESQDLQVVLLTRQLQHCEDHMFAQEELTKHLEGQLKKLKAQYEDALTERNSKIKLSLHESLRRNENEIRDLEKSFADKEVELKESQQQFHKSRNRYSRTSASEMEIVLRRNLEQCRAELEIKDRIIVSLQQAAQEEQYNQNLELQSRMIELLKRDVMSLKKHAEETQEKYNALLTEKHNLENELENLKLNIYDTDSENSNRTYSLEERSNNSLSYENLILENETLKNKNFALLSVVEKLRRTHSEETQSSEVIFEFNNFSKESQSDASVYNGIDEIEALRSQIEKQTHLIQYLQNESKRRESHLVLIEKYQNRCACLQMLEDEYKYLKKKYEELLQESEISRSKWQEKAECVCVLEEKTKLLRDSNKKLRDDLSRIHKDKQILENNKNILSDSIADIRKDHMALLEENTLLRNNVTNLQEEYAAASDRNEFLTNELSRLLKDNKKLSDALSDKENTIQAQITNEVSMHNKLMEVTNMKNSVELDLVNLKNLHAIQVQVSKQNEKSNMNSQLQIEQLTSELLTTQQHYHEAKNLEMQYIEVSNKNLLLEKEISNVNARYEKQISDNNKQILDLQQELSSNQIALKDMAQRIEEQNRLLTEKDSEIHQIEINLSNNMSSMESEIQHLSQQVQQLNSELSIKCSEYIRLGSKNTVLKSKLNDAESEISMLQQVITDKETEFSKQLEVRRGEVLKLKGTVERLTFELLQRKDESTKLFGVKSKIEELQRELMKKADTEITLQRSLTRMELLLTREREKVIIKHKENVHLKSELFSLKSKIAKLEQNQPTVLTQGPEHDVTTEEFLSLTRETVKLREEIDRLTALYENSNVENYKLQCLLTNFRQKLVYTLNQTRKDKTVIREYHHKIKMMRAFNGVLKIEKIHIEKEYNKLENDYNTLKNYYKQQDKETIFLEEELQVLRENHYENSCYSDGDASCSLSDARKKIRFLNEKVLHLQSIINSLINSNSKVMSSWSKIRISQYTASLSVQPFGRNYESYYLWLLLQEPHQPNVFEQL